MTFLCCQVNASVSVLEQGFLGTGGFISSFKGMPYIFIVEIPARFPFASVGMFSANARG